MKRARLSDLLQRDLPVDPLIAGVTADSRKVRPGFLFAALSGSTDDGARYVPQALGAGAAAVSGALGAAPELARLVLLRYAAAIARPGRMDGAWQGISASR